MTINEALKEICSSQIPKEVNGVNTEYIIREYRADLGNKMVEVSILPTNITKKNLSVSRKYSDGYYKNYNYCRDSLGYGIFVQDICDLLCMYIRNINKWTGGSEGRVVREIKLDLVGDNNDL